MFYIKPGMASEWLIAVQGVSTSGVQVAPEYIFAGVEIGDSSLVCLHSDRCQDEAQDGNSFHWRHRLVAMWTTRYTNYSPELVVGRAVFQSLPS